MANGCVRPPAVIGVREPRTAPQKREQQPCVYSYRRSIRAMARIAQSDEPMGIFSTSVRVSTTTRTPAHVGGLALVSPPSVLVSSVQSLVAVVACELDLNSMC
jgi:hypothetical protein